MFRKLITYIDDMGFVFIGVLAVALMKWPVPVDATAQMLFVVMLALIVLRRIRWMIEDHAGPQPEGEA